ncbi:phosphoribosylformylglycinamidine synthase subunit PurQ [Calycomorphotria hydatis]|uniref:Phosphoribosylformylglycinamidine synthase n=1 Tax=Calycomorphotria hydatis TaxID=2528027 RepID=A0A517T842_9PLAN|nr:phosphoribosylformylglycinamidine synthase subunit PurQ [Calycomorphotria hydatis]QDT64549.1 Phosphoribosylformylglycinamidine synthase [Calycomorphotria hydatis]
MPRPRVCVLRAPGTNCDVETCFAFETCGAEPEAIHVARLLENPELLLDFQILCLPGGFSYGDDIGAGVIFAEHLRGKLSEPIAKFLEGDRLILGICNGFQVLMKSGLLPGGPGSWPPNGQAPQATLTWNNSGRFVDRWVRLGRISEKNVFLKGIDEFEAPMAHAEGRIALANDSVLNDWKTEGQVALCYLDRGSEEIPADPMSATLNEKDNPNGSIGNIAGLGDPTGRILGLMPHPERFLFATQHPQWTRKRMTGEGAGVQIFRNAVEYFG